MNTQTQLEPLRLAIHGINAPFYCAGSYIPKKPLVLKFLDNTRLTVQVAEKQVDQAESLRPLIDRCRPATFGDKRRNRYDPQVREAVQLKAESGEFSVEDFDLKSTGILEAIQREMLPPDSPPVTAELYALNIYTRGGHFAPHKDTPRGEDMFGTLVICLPSNFWLGQLTLTHRGLVQQFDWGADIGQQKRANQLHWAAFFGDVDHQIERVGFGARVTLTYLLRRDGRSLPPRSIANEDLSPAIQEILRALLADPSFMPEGGIVGYPCCHLYHQDARFQVKQKPLDRDSANMLKGRDQLVAAAALQSGLSVTFAPYLFETCIDDTWQLDRFPTAAEKRKMRAQMDLRGLEVALPIVGESSEKAGDFGVVWLEEPPSSSSTQNEGRSASDADLPVAERLHSCEYCEWGYFGNEASDVDFYIYAALHIHIPSLIERPRAELRRKAPQKRKAGEIVETGGTKRPVKKRTAASQSSTAASKETTAKPSRKRASKTPNEDHAE